MNECRKRVTIVNRRGLHARASARFVNAVAALPEGTSVKVIKDDHSAGGGSILGLMMLGAARGDTIEIVVQGAEAQAVADELHRMVANGFDED